MSVDENVREVLGHVEKTRLLLLPPDLDEFSAFLRGLIQERQ